MMYTLQRCIDVLNDYNILAEEPVGWSPENIRGLKEVLNDLDYVTHELTFDPRGMGKDMLVNSIESHFKVSTEVAECSVWELNMPNDSWKTKYIDFDRDTDGDFDDYML